jgi:hypothetical protein
MCSPMRYALHPYGRAHATHAHTSTDWHIHEHRLAHTRTAHPAVSAVPGTRNIPVLSRAPTHATIAFTRHPTVPASSVHADRDCKHRCDRIPKVTQLCAPSTCLGFESTSTAPPYDSIKHGDIGYRVAPGGPAVAGRPPRACRRSRGWGRPGWTLGSTVVGDSGPLCTRP